MNMSKIRDFLNKMKKYAHPPARPPARHNKCDGSLRENHFQILIRQGKREALKPKGPLVEFLKGTLLWGIRTGSRL